MLQFFGAALGGALAGWVVGRAAMWVFARLDSTMLDITVSLLAGFAAYFIAEQFHASGVLAAVSCGLLLGRQQHAEFSARTRLETGTVWEFVEFILTALVFLLIGLQLRGIIARLDRYDTTTLVLLGAAVSATLIVSRFVWVFPSIWLPRALFPGLRTSDPLPPWSHSVVLSWAGMRGVVSLAAALALPNSFPGRDLIVFLAFCAIFATLVLQGTTLGWVIRRLGLGEDEQSGVEPEAAQARAELAAASLDAVTAHLDEHGGVEHADAAADLIDEYKERAERASVEGEDGEARSGQLEAQRRLRLVAAEAARDKLNEQVDQIDTDTHRSLVAEIDLEEQQIRRALGEE